MNSPHHDVEYIPLDSGPGEAPPRRRPLASTRFAGRLFLAATLFAGVLVGGIFGRLVPSTVFVGPFHYGPVVTILDSFVGMCVTCPFNQ